MFSRERKTAARPTAALDNQESNLRAARKSLINAPFAQWNGFILRVVFHFEMCSTARRRTLRRFPSVQSRNTPCERVPRTPQARQSDVRREMHEITTTMEINAPPRTVWRCWWISGRMRSGTLSCPASKDLRARAKRRVFIQPVGGKGMTFRPRVLRAVPDQELRWASHAPGYFRRSALL